MRRTSPAMRGHPDMLLGRYIEQRRTQLGYSRDQIAAAIERDKKYIWRVERGGQTISPHLIPTLSTVLKCPLEHFFKPPLPDGFAVHTHNLID